MAAHMPFCADVVDYRFCAAHLEIGQDLSNPTAIVEEYDSECIGNERRCLGVDRMSPA